MTRPVLSRETVYLPGYSSRTKKLHESGTLQERQYIVDAHSLKRHIEASTYRAYQHAAEIADLHGDKGSATAIREAGHQWLEASKRETAPVVAGMEPFEGNEPGGPVVTTGAATEQASAEAGFRLKVPQV